MISIVFLMGAFDELRIYKLEEFLDRVNLKNLTSKESEHLKFEINTLRWAVGLISGLVFALVIFFLNHFSVTK